MNVTPKLQNEYDRLYPSNVDGDWFRGVEMLPNITKPRPRLISTPAFWWMVALGVVAVVAGVAGFLAP